MNNIAAKETPWSTISLLPSSGATPHQLIAAAFAIGQSQEITPEYLELAQRISNLTKNDDDTRFSYHDYLDAAYHPGSAMNAENAGMKETLDTLRHYDDDPEKTHTFLIWLAEQNRLEKEKRPDAPENVIKRMDDLGRVPILKPIRKLYGIEDGTKMEMIPLKTGILLTKYED